MIADYRGGEPVGINSTPTLFINGQPFRGVVSVEKLEGVFGKLVK